MSNYLLDDSGNILTDGSSNRLVIVPSSGSASISAPAGSFTFSGFAVALTERAAMVLRLRYRKF